MIKIFGKSKEEIVGFLIDKDLNTTNVTIEGNCLDISIDTPNDGKDISEVLQKEFENYIYSYNGESLIEVFADITIKNNVKFSVAESLTGGMIASEIVQISGISSVMTEGIVCYSNESKKNRLAVKSETLQKYGAVSLEVAKEMVLGQNNYGVRLAMATTGIAGPTGDTEDKPIGLTYIATKFDDDVTVNKYIFKGDRLTVRKSAANVCIGNAIVLLKKHLKVV